MHLILNGGGCGNQVKESYEHFANLVKNGKIVYIPLAWNHGSYEGCLDFLSNELKPYGITNIDLITDANQITRKKLDGVNGIFIGGGNTYKLLKMLKDTPAFNNLQYFMGKEDSVIMGGSAGALIFGKSIDTCKDDGLNIKNICDINEVNLIDTTGFNVLDGYSLIVHYQKLESQIPQTQKRISRLLDEGYKLICLPEETSLYAHNGKFEFIGSKPAKIINNEMCKEFKVKK